VTRLKWKLILGHSEIVLILTQDRYMVCAEHSIGSEIILDALDGTARYKAQLEDLFGLYGRKQWNC
jgi:hypothetical protein